jgi:hypothetical protein
MIKPEDGEAGEDISSWDGHFWIYLKITWSNIDIPVDIIKS